MAEETFLQLQHSEGIVSQMAARIFAAYIASGQTQASNTEEFLDKSVALAVRLARKVDQALESDDEAREE